MKFMLFLTIFDTRVRSKGSLVSKNEKKKKEKTKKRAIFKGKETIYFKFFNSGTNPKSTSRLHPVELHGECKVPRADLAQPNLSNQEKT